MADETTSVETSEVQAVASATVEVPADEPLGEAGKRALEKEREAAKAARQESATLAARLKEYEDRDKTEAQKLQEERDTLLAERDALRTETWRRDVAAEHGLTPAQARRLVGATREELEADAVEIAATFPATPAAPVFGDIAQGTRVAGNAPVYRQSQLADHQFYLANKADILAAIAEGGARITPD